MYFVNCSHTDLCEMEICSQPSSSECFLDPFTMFYSSFSICLLLQLSCAVYRSLNIFSCVCFLNGKQPSLSGDVTWKIPTHLSSLNFNIAPSEKASSTQSDRMRSLCFHFCIADSVFLGHSTFHLELELLLLIITENLLNSKQWTKYCMYLCTLAYLILTVTQWGLFF